MSFLIIYTRWYDLTSATMYNAQCIIVNFDACKDTNFIATITYAIHNIKTHVYISTSDKSLVPELWKQDHVTIGTKYDIHSFFAKPERPGRIFCYGRRRRCRQTDTSSSFSKKITRRRLSCLKQLTFQMIINNMAS